MKKNQYFVEFIDCPVEGKSRKWLEDYLAWRSDYVIVFFTVYLAKETDLYWAIKVLEASPHNIVIFMGPEPSYRMEEFLINKRTFVIRGEPEETIVELLKEVGEAYPNYKKIKGLSWKDYTVHHNKYREPIEDIDKLPFPDRTLIRNPNKYFNPKLRGKPTTTMITTRNCWGRCLYCIPMAYTFAREIAYRCEHYKKPQVAVRSPENVFEEFKAIKEQGYKSVAIMDDNFMGLPTKDGQERILDICKLISPLGLEWGCLARADQCLDKDILFWMRQAGCVYIDLGVESFNDEILKYVQKDITREQQIRAIQNIKEAGIIPKINILIGCSPEQTKEDIEEVLRILKENEIEYVSFSIVTPHPMTEYYKKAKKYMTTKDWVGTDTYRESIINLPHLSKEDLEEMSKKCYKDFYLRPSYIWKRIKKVRSFRELTDMSKVFYRLFF